MAAFEIVGVHTSIASTYMHAAFQSSFNYTVTDFAIGDRGHDPNNPRISLTPDLNQTEYNAGFPLLFGPAPLSDTGLAVQRGSFYEFTLEEGQAVGEWSQINLIATVISSPGSLPDGTELPGVGEQFLFAIVNRPLTFRTPNETDTYRITVFI